jgi:hypothetical protein
LLAFPPNAPPAFEDSPFLRHLAARQIGVRVNQFGRNGTMLLEKLLHDVWEQQLVRPGAQGNSTGCILVSADLCTQASQALMIYEDFSDLVGLHTWNPANEVEPVRLDNPATSVLIEHGIDPSQDYAECLPAEIVDQLERSMRSDLGSVGALIRQEEIYDGLVRPNKLITAWSLSLDWPPKYAGA